jgi:hypothetical protein
MKALCGSSRIDYWGLGLMIVGIGALQVVLDQVQGGGFALIFVPLTTVIMDPISNESMGNATSIFNLMRNVGGSTGIAST